MRKNELRRLANNQLMNDNRGSHRDKQYRHFVIHKIMDDLFKLKSIPGKWHGLTQAHICALVVLWKKQKIKPTTMMKYMTVIRYFIKSIGHTVDDIDNQSLGIVRVKPKTKVKPKLDDALQKISHLIARTIFQLQSEFGLTFSEATRLIPALHIRDHSLWLTRDITFNHQDRIIPIRHDAQIHILSTLSSHIANHQSLISAHGYRGVLHLYRLSMQDAGLSASKSYRYLYAAHQLPLLLQAFSNHEASEIIMREMGLKSRTTLWEYLQHE